MLWFYHSEWNLLNVACCWSKIDLACYFDGLSKMWNYGPKNAFWERSAVALHVMSRGRWRRAQPDWKTHFTLQCVNTSLISPLILLWLVRVIFMFVQIYCLINMQCYLVLLQKISIIFGSTIHADIIDNISLLQEIKKWLALIIYLSKYSFGNDTLLLS